MEASTSAAAAAHRLVTTGSHDEIRAMLRRAPPRSTAASLLAAGDAWCRGDIRRADAALREALTRAPAGERAYVADAAAALLVACGRFGRAGALVEEPCSDPGIEPARAALRSVVLAARGALGASIREADAARRGTRNDDARDAMLALVAARLAHAALLRDDAAEAVRIVAGGLRAASARPRTAAVLHQVAFAVEMRLRGDAGAAWHHALAARRQAAVAGDVILRARAGDAVAELAAERADWVRARDAMRARPSRLRHGGEPFGVRLAAVLLAAHRDSMRDARAAAAALERETFRSPGERALCRAVLALISVALDDHAGARRLGRRAISTSGRPGSRTAPGEVRRVRIARALAAVASEACGDVARAHRAAAAVFLREDRAVFALWDSRDAPADRSPPAVRGYAQLATVARARSRAHGARGPLTAAEVEVLRAIEAGLTVAQIAARSGRSTHTVRTHLRNASAKLDAHGRADLLARARACGAL